jgi:lysophospholipase L1-like esterase
MVTRVAPAQAQHIASGDARIQLLGRWTERDGAQMAWWPAAAIRVRVSGGECRAILSTTGDDYLAIWVDGKPLRKLKLGKSPQQVVITEGVDAGEHTIELIKATESFVGAIRFAGLDVPGGTRLLPLPPVGRRIEFIGDSITAGYGNEDPDRTHHFRPDTENASLTYAVFSAHKLKADWSCVAISGICLGAVAQDDPMPKRYSRVDPWNEGDWDFTRSIPDAVVINLGTNDANQKPFDEARYTQAWIAFFSDIRRHYPKAHIFCTVAPMGENPVQVRCIGEAVAAANAAGDARVHAVKLPSQDEKLDGIGADWHPTVKCHARLADVLAPVIARELDW